METKTILQKLHAIMGEIDRIAKDKKNDFHNYQYASEQAIKEALHPLLVKHGVLFTVDASNVRREAYVTNKGGRGAITDVDMEYRFHDVKTGDFISGKFVGTGDDSADKGTYKAITGAIKYILTSTFLIPTGDDPEVTTGNDTAPVAPVRTSTSKALPPMPAGMEMHEETLCQACGAIMTFKEGLTKAGKPYRAYFCADKTHPPLWM